MEFIWFSTNPTSPPKRPSPLHTMYSVSTVRDIKSITARIVGRQMAELPDYAIVVFVALVGISLLHDCMHAHSTGV
jgi:hypothetical protein